MFIINQGGTTPPITEQVKTPVIAVTEGYPDRTVTITCETAGAAIHYTTDGTTPTSASAQYNASFNLTGADGETKTVKAIAVKSGMNNSAVATKEVAYVAAQVAKPVIAVADGHLSRQITITTTTEGATIYYTTDRTKPTTASTKYTAPFDLTGTDGEYKLVKAIAVKENMRDSEIDDEMAAFVDVPAANHVERPIISFSKNEPVEGETVTVTISTRTPDSTIYYTLDGSEPVVPAVLLLADTAPAAVTGTQQYTDSFQVTGTVDIKCIAVRNGYTPSPMAGYTLQFASNGDDGPDDGDDDHPSGGSRSGHSSYEESI